jgi:hypothetical protein
MDDFFIFFIFVVDYVLTHFICSVQTNLNVELWCLKAYAYNTERNCNHDVRLELFACEDFDVSWMTCDWL